MKNNIILILLLLPLFVKAQQWQEYNRKGEEAFLLKDYEVAKFWYEEGVANCDTISIKQLTEIWRQDTTMHRSMRIVIGKCLDCLSRQAQANDTLAIKKLIDYYTEGIGTDISVKSANFWADQLERLRKPTTNIYIPSTPKEKMKFFIGYHASLIAPFGIQVGGMGKSAGWYVRFLSNLSFQETPYDYKVEQGQMKIQQLDKDNVYYRPTTENPKKTHWMGSAGIMVKATSGFYVSAGVGYWDCKYSREFIRVNDDGTDIPASSDWARNINESMSGVTIDLDGTFVISGKVYGTMGASLMNFKYIYPNIGVGFIF